MGQVAYAPVFAVHFPSRPPLGEASSNWFASAAVKIARKRPCSPLDLRRIPADVRPFIEV